MIAPKVAVAAKVQRRAAKNAKLKLPAEKAKAERAREVKAKEAKAKEAKAREAKAVIN